MLEGIQTKCFNETEDYIKKRYGNDWNVPWKLCDKQSGSWYKNKQSPHYKNDSEAR